MPFDTTRFNQLTGGHSWLALLTSRRFVPVDLDYGVVPYAEDEPTWANAAMWRMEIERYREHYPEIQQDSTLFLSLGAVRLRRVAPEFSDTSLHAAVTIEVGSRGEFDRIIARLRKWVGPERYQIWFRGQDNDYRLDDFSDARSRSICPWRSQRDTSLVPSLYRELTKRLADPLGYARFCSEYARYSLFLSHDVNAPQFVERRVDDPPIEPIEADWYRRTMQPTFVRTDDGVSAFYLRRPGQAITPPQGKRVVGIRDYHPIWHGLQHVFFMQHYGLASPVLDITYSPDVALFFAQNHWAKAAVSTVDFETSTPVVYVFLLRPDLDMFVNSQGLSEAFGLLRPKRQRCGLMFGASFINRNDYARFIALKLRLKRPISHTVSPEYLIPSRAEDGFLERLLRFAAEQKFTALSPWA